MSRTRTRPAGAPAYYLGRPAAIWLAATTRRQTSVRSGPGRNG